MQTSFIHNWRWWFAAPVATLIVVGFSCGDGGNQQKGASDDVGSASTSWTTYRSEKLGMSIPYPEGWYVDEVEDGTTIFFYDGRPPAESDMPERVSVTIDQRQMDAVRESLPAIVDEITGTRRDHSITTITHYRDRDPASDEERRVAFVWTSEGKTIVVDGVEDDSVLDRIVDEMLTGGVR